MSTQRQLHPSGLSRTQFDCLSECSETAVALSRKDLLKKASHHLALVATCAINNQMINIKLAQAVGSVIEKIVANWESLPDSARYWLAGAILYFSSNDDDEPDFRSPIGFEDDADVLNACLQFANLNHLCLKVEDYDHV